LGSETVGTWMVVNKVLVKSEGKQMALIYYEPPVMKKTFPLRSGISFDGSKENSAFLTFSMTKEDILSALEFRL